MLHFFFLFSFSFFFFFCGNRLPPRRLVPILVPQVHLNFEYSECTALTFTGLSGRSGWPCLSQWAFPGETIGIFNGRTTISQYRMEEEEEEREREDLGTMTKELFWYHVIGVFLKQNPHFSSSFFLFFSSFPDVIPSEVRDKAVFEKPSPVKFSPVTSLTYDSSTKSPLLHDFARTPARTHTRSLAPPHPNPLPLPFFSLPFSLPPSLPPSLSLSFSLSFSLSRWRPLTLLWRSHLTFQLSRPL